MSNILHAANVGIFLLCVVGAALHHNRRLHVRLMLLAFVLDIGLLLAVELTDSAVGQAMQGMSDGAPMIMWIHIAFALGGLIMWGVQIWNGRKVLKGDYSVLKRHALGAKIFMVMRLGNVITAFMV